MDYKHYLPYLLILASAVLFVFVNTSFIEEDDISITTVLKQFLLFSVISLGTFFYIEKNPFQKEISTSQLKETIIPGPPKFTPF